MTTLDLIAWGSAVGALGYSLWVSATVWRGELRYRKTRKELERYLTHLHQAVENNDLEAFKRWSERIDEVVEHELNKLNP